MNECARIECTRHGDGVGGRMFDEGRLDGKDAGAVEIR